jgi:hypothetical protein
VFMASHFDRQYCGKCGLTYVFQKPKDQAWTHACLEHNRIEFNSNY